MTSDQSHSAALARVHGVATAGRSPSASPAQSAGYDEARGLRDKRGMSSDQLPITNYQQL